MTTSTTALAAINTIISADDADDRPSAALRDLLIDRDATPIDSPHNDDAPASTYDALRALLLIIDAEPYSTELMTSLLLDYSLCPLHAIDYATCFDDDDDECAAIRAIHPSHDT